MAQVFIAIVIIAFLGIATGQSGTDFTIQNAADGSFLSNLEGNDKLCTPLSKVTTENVLNVLALEAQKWTLHYWGNSPDQFGFHLISKHQMSEITYDTKYPPFCYPVYNGWDIDNKGGIISSGPTQIKLRDGGCLVSNGPSRRIEYEICDSQSQAQFWIFNQI